MTEFRTRLRLKPGSLTEDGNIVVLEWDGRRGIRSAGCVWIERKRLPVAKRFGWVRGMAVGNLVEVRR